MKDKKTKKTLIGGQAVMEGVMMRGMRGMALAVRDTQGNLLLKTERLKKTKGIIRRIPIIRGAVMFFQTMVTGVKILLKSAEVYSEEDGESEITNGAAFLAVFLGLAFSVVLFMFLPSLISDGVKFLVNKWWGYKSNVLTSIIEGVTRLVIFLVYLISVSFLKDIKRTFMYHGAEHKTINCFEKDLELNVQNVKSCSRLHDRCGTTFLFLVMIVSIILFTLSNAFVGFLTSVNPVWAFFATWYGKIIIRLILLPLVAGLSYELLKISAMLPDNLFMRIIKAPGLALQYLTTKEPDEGMIEVAIKAFSAVDEMEKDDNVKCVNWDEMDFKEVKDEFLSKLKEASIHESEADWILTHVLKTNRLSLKTLQGIKRNQYYAAKKIVDQRIEKRLPLQYIIGDVDFCGYKIIVNKNVLIPRFETEVLATLAVDKVQELVQRSINPKVLDLCTGSGCVAVVIGSRVKNSQVTASDISTAALEVARQNCKNITNINLIQSDLFQSITDTFDIIVTNPPYVKTNELIHLSAEVKQEPKKALDGGEDGLDIIKRIIKDGAKHLNPDGLLIMEVGINQPEIIKDILDNEYKDIYTSVEIINDLDGIQRIILCKRAK